MALYAFDGTGNKDKKKPGKDSNVLKFFQVYKKAFPRQGNTYITGIGSGHLPRVIKDIKKVVGAGGKKKVAEGMKALEKNLKKGDTQINIVGFSRGAAEALQFANDIHNNEIQGQKGRPIGFLGLWDTVASFGNPLNQREPHWDLDLPKNVKTCCHALALDERRQTFTPKRQAAANAFEARKKGIREVWFRGYHSDVGGGNENVGLSSIPLIWMFRRAIASGIKIDPKLYDKYIKLVNPGAEPKKPTDPKESPKRKIKKDDVVHASVFNVPKDPGKKFQANNPPLGLRVAGRKGNILTERFPVSVA